MSKIYENGVVALRDMSMQIPEKQRTVFFGPSGCGKTTLLRMIAGLESITSGNIRIPPSLKISFMFQNDRLLDALSVKDNIAYGIDQRTISKSDLARKVEDTARLVGVASILEQKCKTLSGGQRQRISLARALIKEPDLLLIDEGLNSLDQTSKYELIDTLIKLQETKQFTLLYVTHDAKEAKKVGQNFIEFKKEGD
ncbi:ABC transporter ATP-binding protein [Faecalicoccus pleomorphus]|uniref:ATP-binding cassette domain-containing protein n=1 Tax=Faecalicoccus pleomorphus TaxID=1323 RepID=UPI00242CA050|nr:ABC transporter ATP-binding protein [Faecalicoccus pleomorphus]